VTPSGAGQSGSVRDIVITYLKGIAMGAADTVPGVSGGTIALIVGIYERVTRAVTSLDPRLLRLVPSLHRKQSQRDFLRGLREMDIPFLTALGFGMVTAVVALSRVLEYTLEMFPGLTFAFFFGLIAASAIVLFEPEWLSTPSRLGVALAGILFAFLISDPGIQGSLPHSLPVVFVAGSVAISGMVLPGISGAFILLLLGQYEYLVDTLTEFVDGLAAVITGGTASDVVTTGTVVAVFLSGAVIGLFTVAYAVRWALERYRSATFLFLVSLMVGALRLPVTESLNATDSWSPTVVGGLLGAALLGGALVIVADAYTDELGYHD
jgi:putative membrane protein